MTESTLPSEGLELPPVAPILMQSLRAFGYTTSAALADLVDNSIAAGALHVEVRCVPGPDAYVAVLDDGAGMSPETLVEAMRFGSRDPRLDRMGSDLGRFGLGMKTASLSQCRRLTVASVRKGTISVARWDLDECDRLGTWWLDRPPPEALPSEILEALERRPSGTAVVWQVLDRLCESATDHTQLDRAINESVDHLALVFHRFLANEMEKPLEITINDRPLPRLDPFLDGHVKGQSLFGESFTIDGHPVTVSPFVLPYPQRLKADEIDRAGGRESLKVGHGFYIYRGGRLVVPGGWHRIVPADEMVRLARIRVDVPVALDHIWKVDVKKAAAEPPPKLRPHLKRLVQAAAERSRDVITFRTKPKTENTVSVWLRHDGRDGDARWGINRDHPLVVALASGIAEPERARFFRLLEQELPLQAIHVHLSNHLGIIPPEDTDADTLEELAKRMVQALGDDSKAIESLFDCLQTIEPFNRNLEATAAVVLRLRSTVVAA